MRLNYVTDITCNEDHRRNIFAVYSIADRITEVLVLEARSVEDAIQLLASDAANNEHFRIAGPALSRAMRTVALMTNPALSRAIRTAALMKKVPV